MYSHRDQQKYLDTLKKYERKFSLKEYDDFQVLLKRDKDEEEFDSITMKRLKELYDKYYEPADISKYDKYFKKNPEESGDKE